MRDLMHDDCKHESFTYRPYRRGRNRCLECGGKIPLSALGGSLLRAAMDYANTKAFFARLISG